MATPETMATGETMAGIQEIMATMTTMVADGYTKSSEVVAKAKANGVVTADMANNKCRKGKYDIFSSVYLLIIKSIRELIVFGIRCVC